MTKSCAAQHTGHVALTPTTVTRINNEGPWNLDRSSERGQSVKL